MSKEQNKAIQDKVLEAIRKGRATMRPKWHFILDQILVVTGAAIAFLVLLFLASFIFSALRENGLWFAPLFGSRGWFSFLRSLPWVLIILSIVFVVALEILVRRYSFAYRKPLLYSLLAVLFIVIVAGAISIPWHRGFFRAARENRLPPFVGRFYRNFGSMDVDDVHRGVVLSIFSGGFLMNEAGVTTSVLFGPQTQSELIGAIEPGDRVIVFGDRGASGIKAYGIKEVSD